MIYSFVLSSCSLLTHGISVGTSVYAIYVCSTFSSVDMWHPLNLLDICKCSSVIPFSARHAYFYFFSIIICF